jgi:hypothetical protein
VHLSSVWLVPLIVGGVGAAGLATAAMLLGREVEKLQKSLRPLRATRRLSERPGHTGSR